MQVGYLGGRPGGNRLVVADHWIREPHVRFFVVALVGALAVTIGASGTAVATDEPEPSEQPTELERPAEPELAEEFEHLEELEAERDEAEQRAEDAASERETVEDRRDELREELEAATERVEELAEQRDDAEDQLDDVQDRLDAATQEYEDAVDRLTELEDAIEELEGDIAALSESMEDRREHVGDTVRELYKRGGPTDSTNSVFAADGSTEVLQAAGYLRTVQHGQRSVFEGLAAQHRVLEREKAELAELEEEQRQVAAETEEARLAVKAAFEDQEEEVDELHDIVASAEQEEQELLERMEEIEDELASLVAQEDEADAEVAAAEEAIAEELERLARKQREWEEEEAQRLEEEAQRLEEEQAERLEQAESGLSEDRINGRSIACPVGKPRSFVDSYGAPRSGGRSHKGTDIMAPRGTPIYAFESGEIVRMSTNRLGGITLHLRGDSGKRYYYAHLDDYVEDLSTGQRVEAGEQVGYNGDTGNARGTPPHLHIEIRPGGGANVNPYPYMRGACG